MLSTWPGTWQVADVCYFAHIMASAMWCPPHHLYLLTVTHPRTFNLVLEDPPTHPPQLISPFFKCVDLLLPAPGIYHVSIYSFILYEALTVYLFIH